MMQKSPTTKERRQCYTTLSENLTKLAQQTELQLAVYLLSANTQKTKVVILLNKAIHQCLERILLLTLASVMHADDILHMFVCLHFFVQIL